MKATFPRDGTEEANVALSRTAGSVLITPMQLGPTMRMPCFLILRASRSSSSAPTGPTSLKPAVITTKPRTPLRPHSSMTRSTLSRGTAMMARSTGSGIWPTLRKAFIEWTTGALGFTA